MSSQQHRSPYNLRVVKCSFCFSRFLAKLQIPNASTLVIVLLLFCVYDTNVYVNYISGVVLCRQNWVSPTQLSLTSDTMPLFGKSQKSPAELVRSLKDAVTALERGDKKAEKAQEDVSKNLVSCFPTIPTY